MILDLTHRLEVAWLVLRFATFVFVVWDLVDASRDLRYWWNTTNKPQARMLAKWRVGIDLFLLTLTCSWIFSLTWVLVRDGGHGRTTDVLILIQNVVVLFLLILTIYLRRIRDQVVKGGSPP